MPKANSVLSEDIGAQRRVDVFFYGLYMDAELLASKGVKACDPRPAFVDGFGLRIGHKATLVRTPGARAYGMVFALTHGEIQTLYAGLDGYRPEPVLARTLAGQTTPAMCMNLLEPPAPAERNPDYASKLRVVLERLGFPSDYVQNVV